MFKALDLSELRRTPEIAFYFRYPLRHADFREVRAEGRLLGRYAAKPLYGRLTPRGALDRAAGYNGQVAVVDLPAGARSIRSAQMLLTRMPRSRVSLPDGRRDWPAIRAAADRAVRRALARTAVHRRVTEPSTSPLCPRLPRATKAPVRGSWPKRQRVVRPPQQSVSYPMQLEGREAMGKVLVLYDSASGNTAKMAGLVAEGAGSIPGTEVRLRAVADATAEDVLWCDGLALGSPTNMGLLSWKMKRFWDEPMAPHWMKVDGKIACAFSSSGGWGGGTELACQSLLTVLLNFGFLVFGVTDYASKLTTAHYGAITAREPREEGTQAACRLLGKRLAEWVAVFCDGRTDQHPLMKSDPRLPPG